MIEERSLKDKLIGYATNIGVTVALLWASVAGTNWYIQGMKDVRKAKAIAVSMEKEKARSYAIYDSLRTNREEIEQRAYIVLDEVLKDKGIKEKIDSYDNPELAIRSEVHPRVVFSTKHNWIALPHSLFEVNLDLTKKGLSGILDRYDFCKKNPGKVYFKNAPYFIDFSKIESEHFLRQF